MFIKRLDAAIKPGVTHIVFAEHGIAMRRKPEGGPLEVVFFHDMTPMVPWRQESRHTLVAGRFEPPIPRGRAKEFVGFVQGIFADMKRRNGWGSQPAPVAAIIFAKPEPKSRVATPRASLAHRVLS